MNILRKILKILEISLLLAFTYGQNAVTIKIDETSVNNVLQSVVEMGGFGYINSSGEYVIIRIDGLTVDFDENTGPFENNTTIIVEVWTDNLFWGHNADIDITLEGFLSTSDGTNDGFTINFEANSISADGDISNWPNWLEDGMLDIVNSYVNTALFLGSERLDLNFYTELLPGVSYREFGELVPSISSTTTELSASLPIAPQIGLANRPIDDDTYNLKGELSLSNTSRTEMDYNNKKSGGSATVKFNDNYTIKTHDEILEEMKHHSWKNSPNEYLMNRSSFELEDIVDELTANYQDEIDVSVDLPTGVDFQDVLVYDPWYAYQDATDEWIQPEISRSLDVINGGSGDLQVFENQNENFYSNMAIYSLKAPQYYATESGLYKFVEWTGPNIDFGNGTNNPTSSYATEVVFKQDGAIAEAVYTQINNSSGIYTLHEAEILLMPDNFDITLADGFQLKVSGILQHNSNQGDEKSIFQMGDLSHFKKEVTGYIYMDNVIFKNESPGTAVSKLTISSDSDIPSGVNFTRCVFENIDIDNNAGYSAGEYVPGSNFVNCTLIYSPLFVGWDSDSFNELNLINTILYDSDVTWLERHVVSGINISYCNYYGSDLTPDATVTNSINTDPLFVSGTDYNLMLNSPCKDSGDPNPIYNDIDGTNSDMGANYFYQKYGDVTTDYTVDVLDLTAIVGYTLETVEFTENQLRNGDVSSPHDESVDVLDVVALVTCINSPGCDQQNITRSSDMIASGNATFNFSYTEGLGRSDDQDNIISINSEVPVQGFQMTVEYDEVEFEFSSLEKLDAAMGLTLEYNSTNLGVVKFLLYPEDSFEIPAGEHDILQLSFTGLGRSNGGVLGLIYLDPIMADPHGNKINIVSSLEIPLEFALYHAYPNPFNPVTNLNYSIPEKGNVSLIVYDMVGREVNQLVNTYMEAGYHSIQWDATSFASGVYMVKLVAGDFTQTQKVALVK